MPSGDHSLTARTFISRPRVEVFAFFAAAENLERITPPEPRFQIMTPLPVRIAAGALIDYRIRLFGIPFQWKTLISRWEPDVSFVDEQVTGPYAKWVHTHSFHDAPGGTLVTDEVRYRLPWFPLGEVAYPLMRLQLQRVFDYRARRLRELLPPPVARCNAVLGMRAVLDVRPAASFRRGVRRLRRPYGEWETTLVSHSCRGRAVHRRYPPDSTVFGGFPRRGRPQGSKGKLGLL